MAKLTDQQRKEIITRRANGETLQKIADEYGVTKACISIMYKKANQNKVTVISAESVSIPNDPNEFVSN